MSNRLIWDLRSLKSKAISKDSRGDEVKKVVSEWNRFQRNFRSIICPFIPELKEETSDKVNILEWMDLICEGVKDADNIFWKKLRGNIKSCLNDEELIKDFIEELSGLQDSLH